MKKIDIHCHILPGIDDGANSYRESLKMLEIACAEGITDIIATPHYHYKRGKASPEEILDRVDELQERARERKIPVRIHSGNELYYTHDLLKNLKAGNALTLAESDYALLEFSIREERRTIRNAVYEFLSEGYYPILAHVERYPVFRKDTEFLKDILEMGAYAQVNADSFFVQAGWDVLRFSKKIMKENLVQFVATDAHDTEKYRPALQKWSQRMERRYGKETCGKYLFENPEKILKNMEL